MFNPTNSLLNRGAEDISKKKYFVIYTAIFAVMAAFVFYHFADFGLTFVRDGDGYYQHYTALEYYGKWLRSIIYNLFSEHRLVIPNWDFSIGMGSDVVTTFNYYVIGDPLALLSVLCPVKYTPYFYTLLCVLRYYLIGFFFSLYCFERKHKSYMGVLVSAFTYTFCSYSFYAGTMHPYFINPMIYLPIILIAVEKIFKNKNPMWLALIVCIAEVSNFYFFYVVVIATVVYVCLRLFEIYGKDIKSMIAPLFKIGFSSVTGVLLGAVIFFPIVIKLFSDSRMSVGYDYTLFYALKYYLRLPAAMISHNYWGGWTLLGYSVIILFAVTALFTVRKKHTFLKIFFLIGIVGFMSPKFAGFANGFSYPCNRWGFVFSLIIAFVVSATWKDVFESAEKRTYVIAALPVVYVGLCFLSDYTLKERMIVSTASVVLISALIILYRLVLVKKANGRIFVQLAVLALCFVCIVTNAHFVFYQADEKYYSAEKIANYHGEDTVAVKKQAEADGENGFFRYTGDKVSINDNVRRGMSNTQYYWSLSDESISDFHQSISINEGYYQFYNGFDDITAYNTLASVKYYYDTENKNTAIPYGYVETATEDVWLNTNFLPLGYTYDSYALRSDYDALESSVDKQQMLLQSVVLEESPEGYAEKENEYVTKKLDSRLVIKDENVTYKDNTFIVTENNSVVYFILEPQKESELYISLKGIKYKGFSLYQLYGENTDIDPENLYSMDDFNALAAETQEKIKKNHLYWAEQTIIPFKVGGYDAQRNNLITAKQIQYFTPNFTFYCNKSDFDANIGYSEEGFGCVAVKFPYIGKYSFDEIDFYSQTMDIYDEGVMRLGEETLENIVIGTDTVKGNITVSENKLLCLSIPYSEGWTAYVDGEEQPLYKANVMFMALALEEGEHEIELRYSTPNMKTGFLISVFGLVLFLLLGLWYYIERKKNRIKFKEID